MNLEITEDSASRFARFVEELTSVIGHADRERPLNDYCAGLLVSEGRRSVEPIAAVTAPHEISVQHQRLLHFVANAPWSDAHVGQSARVDFAGDRATWTDRSLDCRRSSFPKCGSNSVGVQHQYCGQLGKQANCQVAVTLSIANHHASLPIAYRLYLPQQWAKNAARRKKARIPKESFKTKPQIALEQIAKALAAGVPRGVVLTDASYGSNSGFRTGLSALGLEYVAAIIPTIMVRRVTDDGGMGPRLSVKKLALRLPEKAWRTITWREGTNKKLRSRFPRVQVRTAPIGVPRHEVKKRSSSHGPRASVSPPNIGLPPSIRTFHFMRWSIAQKCGGGSSATTWNSSKRWARALRGAGMAGLPPSRDALHRRLRLPDLRKGDDSPSGPHCARRVKNLPFPIVTDPAAPPIRPQRHVPNSIATLHHQLIVAIARMLPRCPYCATRYRRNMRLRL